MIIISLMCTIAVLEANAQIASFGPSGNVEQDRPLTLKCILSSAFVGSPINLNRNNSLLNSCFSAGFCTDGLKKTLNSINFTFTIQSDSVLVALDTVPKSELGIQYKCEFSGHTEVYTIQLSESGTDGKSCDEPLIYVLYFILTLVCIATTFFLVIWFNLRCPNVGKVVLIIIGVVVDLLFEIILLWGIEYGGNFKLFKSDINCPVVIIGVVCHVVAVVVEIVKVIVQYLYIEELGARIFVCCRPDGEIKKVRKSAVEEHPSHTLLPAYGDGRKGSSDDNQSKKVAKPEDIMLFMHFNVPLGYTVNKWVTEENASIENNPKYVSNDRGTLLIKSATEKDNGIYQGILTSDGNEQRVNAVLHVTGQKSANLIINPLIWRQVKTKKLKKINDLKEIRHKVSRNDIGSIPTKNEDESNVSIKSIRWVLNGKIAHTSSDYKDGDDSVPPHTVTKNLPIDEYHCTVEFSNKKSHVYIFIVKFTGVRSGNSDDVVGVPTILSTRREETTSSLPPLSSSLEEKAHGHNSAGQANF